MTCVMIEKYADPSMAPLEPHFHPVRQKGSNEWIMSAFGSAPIPTSRHVDDQLQVYQLE